MKLLKPLLLAAALTLAVGARPQGAGPGFESLTTEKIKDLAATLRIDGDKTDFDALKKIGRAFATSYRIPRYQVAYKFPNKLRVEGKIGPLSALVIYDGNTKTTRVPFSSKTKDVTGEPGQKQSLMDLGVFATDWTKTDYKPIFVRREGALVVYKLTQRFSDNTSYELVWVNPKTHLTEKRQSLNGENILQKELHYVSPKEFAPGIWLPTRVEIYNADHQLGAVQEVEAIKVNAGIDDGRFKP